MNDPGKTDILQNACFAKKEEWWPDHITESAWLEHTPFVAWLVPNLEPKIIVELGTHRAVSYMAFCQANARLSIPAKCFAVDTWEGDAHAGRYAGSIFQDVKHLNQRYEAFSTLLRGTFDEALPKFQDGTVDLLHIDGFHTYEAVSKDFNSWLPKMSKRGVVLFHDTEVRKGDFGVWRLWGELSQRYPHFDFSHGHGLGLLVVGSDAPREIHELCRLVDDNSKTAKLKKLFSQRGGEVTEYYQKKHEAELPKTLHARATRFIKRSIRGMVPLSIQKNLEKFRAR